MVNTHAGGFRGQQTAEGEGHTPGTSGQEGQTGLVCRRLGTHVGVALQQEMSPGSLQPLGFSIRKLNTTEQKYFARGVSCNQALQVGTGGEAVLRAV